MDVHIDSGRSRIDFGFFVFLSFFLFFHVFVLLGDRSELAKFDDGQ